MFKHIKHTFFLLTIALSSFAYPTSSILKPTISFSDALNSNIKNIARNEEILHSKPAVNSKIGHVLLYKSGNSFYTLVGKKNGVYNCLYGVATPANNFLDNLVNLTYEQTLHSINLKDKLAKGQILARSYTITTTDNAGDTVYIEYRIPITKYTGADHKSLNEKLTTFAKSNPNAEVFDHYLWIDLNDIVNPVHDGDKYIVTDIDGKKHNISFSSTFIDNLMNNNDFKEASKYMLSKAE